MKEGNKRYLIEITEIVSETTLTDREWAVINEVGDVRERGYTPQVETIKKTQREVFKQNTSELDLVAVIKAINEIN
jgi:hypothetical protein